MGSESEKRNFFLLLLSRTWGNLVFIAGCVFFLWMTGKIRLIQPEGQLPVTVWPKFMLFALIVAMGAKTVETAVKLFAIRDQAAPPSAWSGIRKRELAITTGFLISLPILWELIGFAFANIVFMATFLFFGGERKVWKIALFTLVATATLLYLFLKVVYMDLPTGMGIVDDMTRYLYKALHIF